MSFARSLTLKLLGTLLVTALLLAHAAAQPPMGGGDPFGAGGAPPAGPRKPGAPPVAPDEIRRAESIVIQQIRESNPTTALQIIGAAQSVLNFGRPDECKKYLEKFVAGKFPDDQLAALPATYGSAFFVDLGSNEKLQPEGAQVSTQVLTAAKKASEDPARLAALVKAVSDTNFEAASTALTKLEQAGPNLVGPVLQAIADPARSAEHQRLYAALIDLADTTTAPLLGTLAAAPEAQQIIAANVLGELRSRDAVRHLLAPALAPEASPPLQAAARRALTKIMGGVPKLHESELYLLRQFEQLKDGQQPFTVDADNNTIVWQWDDASKAPKASTLPLQDALRQLYARLATDLVKINAKNPEYQRLRLLHQLEFAKAIGGQGRPLAPTSPVVVLAKEAGPDMVVDVLSLAMTQKMHAAAIGATEILSLTGDAKLLSEDSPYMSVLSTALTHADRRVRNAAALAIVKYQPQKAFPGSSHVVEVLGDAVRTAGVDRALVIDGRGDYAQTIAGLLADQGYLAEIAVGSHDAFRKATNGTDYEFILVSDVLDLPVTEMVQLLRRDRRTALLPIGVIVGTDTVADVPKIIHDRNYRDPVGKIRSRSVDDVAVLLANDSRTYVAPRPHNAETVSFLTGEVRKRAGRDWTSREERLANGRAALAALKTLASDKDTLNRYGVLRTEPALIAALNNPTLLAPAAEVLGMIASPKAQTALVDVASQVLRPLSDRQAALAGLQVAIKSRGIGLTKQQILDQYARYNASENLDSETQAVLSGVLDALESRRPAVPTSAPAKP
ncbi:hypothetical protein [Anatilimnocola floriformis]|uniref:hypothetical protein n=1 Tax=Anatilimnocola floriformis TaxID=2948575 RepID=UPI0020C4673C|nr:hypothetical protein [Anatilimnocola floriformis]